ncbi:hypothetical protein CIW54_07920 [Paraburkholderia sp. T12-10]|jgi:hypothetical protein|nr:hypothetical protein CIW54_07920 [Paraburkholderia sp. T12-10]
MNPIDPVEFGRVLARLDEQDKTIDEMRQDIKSLLAMANRGKGALFILMSVSSVIGAVMGALGHHFFGK